MRPQNIVLALLLFFTPPLIAQVPKNNLDVHHTASRTSVASSMETKSDQDRKSTRLNSSHLVISYAVFCLKKKKTLVQPMHIDVLRRTLEQCAMHQLSSQ